MTLIAAHMDDVLAKHANVTSDGVANFAIQSFVMPDAMSMDNVKMVLAFV